MGSGAAALNDPLKCGHLEDGGPGLVQADPRGGDGGDHSQHFVLDKTACFLKASPCLQLNGLTSSKILWYSKPLINTSYITFLCS